MKTKAAAFLLVLSLGFVSCATQHVTPRAQNNLEAWDRDMVYDPVTKRSYHSKSIQESQYYDPLSSDVRED